MNRFRKFFSTAQQISINRGSASLLLLMTTSTISYASSYAEHPEFKKFFDQVTIHFKKKVFGHKSTHLHFFIVRRVNVLYRPNVTAECRIYKL